MPAAKPITPEIQEQMDRAVELLRQCPTSTAVLRDMMGLTVLQMRALQNYLINRKLIVEIDRIRVPEYRTVHIIYAAAEGTRRVKTRVVIDDKVEERETYVTGPFRDRMVEAFFGPAKTTAEPSA